MDELQTDACFQPGAVKLCPMPAAVNRLVSWEHKTENVKWLFSIPKNPNRCLFLLAVKCDYFKLLCNGCTLRSWLILNLLTFSNNFLSVSPSGGFRPALSLFCLWFHCHLAGGAVSREKNYWPLKLLSLSVCPLKEVFLVQKLSHKKLSHQSACCRPFHLCTNIPRQDTVIANKQRATIPTVLHQIFFKYAL